MINKIIEEDLEYITSLNLQWDKFKDKTVLVSGISGMIPSYITYTLLYLNKKFKLNIKIIGICRNILKLESKFNDYLDDINFKYYIQDVCETISINEKIDFIIHAASIATPKYYKTNPVDVINANVLGTNNLLKLARDNKVNSFVFFSSASIYGNLSKEKMPITESEYGYVNTLDGSSCYSESKRLGETMCMSWMNQYNVPVIIVRPSHTYGPGIDLDDGRVFSDFIGDILKGEEINLFSNGSAIRQFCYLADATTAFFTIILSGTYGEAYNVGTESGIISISELAYKLSNLFPEKHLKVNFKNRLDKEYQRDNINVEYSDLSKLKSLGWESKYSLEEGFRRTVDSFI